MLSSYLAYHQLFIITLAVREIDLHHGAFRLYIPHSIYLIWLILTCYSGQPFPCVRLFLYST